MKEGLLWWHAPAVTEERAQRRPVFNVARWIGSKSKQARRLSAEPPRGTASSSSPSRLTSTRCNARETSRRGTRGAGLRGGRVDDRRRFVHDTLEQEGWDVEIADAQKVKGLAPLACKTDRIDSMVLAVLSQRELVPAIWLPDPRVRGGARAGEVPDASGQAQVGAQEPGPFHDDQLRQALPGHRPVRGRGPPPARQTRCSGALARQRRRRRSS